MYVAKMKTNNREILIQNQIFINVVIVAVNISMTYYYYLLDYIMSKFQICTYTYSRSFSFCLLWFLQTGEVIALFVSSGNLQCSIAKLRKTGRVDQPLSQFATMYAKLQVISATKHTTYRPQQTLQKEVVGRQCVQKEKLGSIFPQVTKQNERAAVHTFYHFIIV